jgi:hypothetical protein
MRHRNPFRQQIVGDYAPVAAPPHSFGTHNGAAIVTGKHLQFVQSLSERLSCRVIGIISESRDPPERIGRRHRYFCPVAQSPKGGQMMVGDLSVSERFRENIRVELRIRPRARDRAHIDEQINGYLPEQSDELGDCAGRMAYREDCRRRAGLSNMFLRPLTSNPIN